MAEALQPRQITDLSEISEIRKLIFDAIVQYRKMKNRGVVAIFKRDRFDKYSILLVLVMVLWEEKEEAWRLSTP